ncbi:MAG: amidohydrolase family protein [Acidobacteria bacterium]|nr:amidohydrolase family protein [Acidobacteriota bacterium]
MTTTARSMTNQLDEPTVIVSGDSHVGPRLVEDLRPYCPAAYLEDFDNDASKQRYLADKEAKRLAGSDEPVEPRNANLDLAGHYDPHERIADMDNEGIASEVIFHFSQNGENFPWVGQGLWTIFDFEKGAVAYEIYNRWLADFCAVEPARHVGLAYLPTWDIEVAIEEMHRCREAGLKAINFPPPSRPNHIEYNDPRWDPFWAAACDLDMALVTHASGAAHFDYLGGPGGSAIMIFESGGYMARRSVWWLAMSGVFERHPGLRLVITEQFEGWWRYTLHEMDVVGARFGPDMVLDKPPSEYAASNVFIGASFLSAEMAEDAWRHGYDDNVVWGSDYPHVEGTFVHLDDRAAEPITQLSLRNALSNVPAESAVKMVGLNGVRAYGLDHDELVAVAQRIKAPTLRRLTTQPDSLPELPRGSMAFDGQVGFLQT